MAKLVLSKSMHSDWFFLGQDFAVRTAVQAVYFCFGEKQTIQNLQPKQWKKNVNIVILHSETCRKS